MPEDVNSSQKGAGSGFNTEHFTGGVTIAVIALALLGTTFVIPGPFVPRTLAILVAVCGVAIAAGFVPVRGPRDLYGGLALMLLATLALVASADLPGQRGFAFGPGTAPRLFSGLLAFMGAAVAIVGMVSASGDIEKYRIRGPAYVLVSILLFAALIRPFGLVVATYLAFMLSIMGSSEMRWLESLIAAALMTLGCVLLFVYLLNLPFQLWPQPNAHVLLWHQFEDIFRSTLAMFQKAPPRP